MVAKHIARSTSARWHWRVITLLALVTTFGARGDTPVTPQAAPEAQALLAYLHDIHGKKILSGQQEGWRGTNELGFELRHLQKATGKLPAVLGLDAMEMLPGRRGQRPSGPSPVVKNAIDWYSQRNGIVTFCWHWRAPLGKREFYTKDTDFDAARAATLGTPEYEAALRDMDAIAEQLKLLQAAHVPVLWRPFHEANGRWFWWGAAGPDACNKLWRIMYDRFTTHHHLDNLIWVFSPGAGIDLAAWYPGAAYVDMIGLDHYPMDGSHAAAKDIYDELVALGSGTKLVAMTENGPIPDPAHIAREKADWLFFVTWSGNELTKYNSPELLKNFYSHPHVASLGDLPKLKEYPFHAAGQALKLAFSESPQDFGIGSPPRRALTILVQDAGGRTVRAGSYAVTLASKSALGERTLTASTINGVATFPQLVFDRAVRNCTLTATAPGLRKATSRKFSIGPGTGLLRETWTVAPIAADDPVTPQERAIVRQSFEVPVQMATNFQSRFTAKLIPPQSGEYQFWIANDDRSELWLSKDATPERKVKIAEVRSDTPYAKWPHTKEAASPPVKLEAGKPYHLEVFQQQHAGSTHLSVRWRLPNGIEEKPIPAARLVLPESAADLK